MPTYLAIARKKSNKAAGSDGGIPLDDWLEFVTQSKTIRLTPPKVLTNPFTKAQQIIHPPAGKAWFETPGGGGSIEYVDGQLNLVAENDDGLSVAEEIAGALRAWVRPMKPKASNFQEWLQDEMGASISPFDPEEGIAFKSMGLFQNKSEEIERVEAKTGFKLPADFLEMIGEYCAGDFDGCYRVHEEPNLEVQWTRLLSVRFTQFPEPSDVSSLDLIQSKPGLFSNKEGGLFPFGSAQAIKSPDDVEYGYLAFDRSKNKRVVYVAEYGGRRIEIAKSFRGMMLASHFVFFG